MRIQTREKRKEFRFEHIGANHIAIFPHPDIHTYSCIQMTGADVKKKIQIPYMHRIIKLVLIHMKSTYAKCTDAMNWSIELEAGGSPISPKLTDLLFTEADTQKAEIIETFGVEFEYEAREWTLTLKTTATDLVLPVLYIQAVGAIKGV